MVISRFFGHITWVFNFEGAQLLAELNIREDSGNSPFENWRMPENRLECQL